MSTDRDSTTDREAQTSHIRNSLADEMLQLQTHVLNSMSEGVSVSDEAGIIVYTNPAEDRMFGYAPGELIGCHVTVLNAYDREENDRIVAEVLAELQRTGIWVGEWLNRRKDGTSFYTQSHISAFERQGAKFWVCVQRDVTARKLAENEREMALEREREATALLDAIFASAPIGLAFLDRQLRFRRLNARLAEFNGLPAEMHQGKRPDELLPGVEDFDSILTGWREVLDSGRPWLNVEVRGQIPADSGRARVWQESFFPVRVAGETVGLGAVINEITERKQLEAELRQTVEKLAEADRRKDEFLATLAHELRNPLAPIRNAVQILTMPGAESAQQQWSREVIDRQVQHMARLLDDLLDVSRITRGTLELRKEPVSVRSAFEAAIEIARPLIDAKSHMLLVELPSEPVQVDADPVRLTQILGNLLTNAAKYTDAGGRIRLEAAIDGADLVLRVLDNGVGMTETLQANLFQMFIQDRETIGRAEGGLGVGLALTRGLVELHGGSIQARSDGPGRGSEFVVRLPLPSRESRS